MATHLLIPISDIEDGKVKINCTALYSPKSISLSEDDINKMKISTGGRGVTSAIMYREGYRQALKDLLK